jgi:hypothetical protein
MAENAITTEGHHQEFDRETTRGLASGGIRLKAEKRDNHERLRLFPAFHWILAMRRAMVLIRHPSRCPRRTDLPEVVCALRPNRAVIVHLHHRWDDSEKVRSRRRAQNHIVARLYGR